MRIYGMHLYNRGEPNQPTLKPSAGRRQQERDLAARRAAATLSCYGAAAGGRAAVGLRLVGLDSRRKRSSGNRGADD